MTDFYLITGFLGAGKTSLLNYILPLFKGRSVRLIVNEFGKVGLDGTLLGKTGVQAVEIVDGSIFCACRLDQFVRALGEAMVEPPDVLCVEASGLSDPGAIRDILSDFEAVNRLRYRGAICLVDAPRFEKVFSTARSCRKQLGVADIVLINKCDLVSAEQLDRVQSLIGSVCAAPVIRTTYGEIDLKTLDSIVPARHTEESDLRPDVTLQKETVEVSRELTRAQLEHFLRMVAEDTYRIKGAVDICDGRWLVDSVGTDIRITPYEGAPASANALNFLAGPGMPLRKSLKQAMAWYPGLLAKLP